MLISLLSVSSLAWSWDQVAPLPRQLQADDQDDDDQYADDRESTKEPNTADAGDSSVRDGGSADAPGEKAPPARRQKTGAKAPGIKKTAVPPAAAPPARAPAAAKPPTTPRPPAAVPPAALPPSAVPPVRPSVAVPAAPAKKPGPIVAGQLLPALQYNQGTIVWELRILWAIIGLFGLAFVLLFLHFLIPVGGLRFLSQGSHLFLILGTIGLGATLIYRFFYLGHLPGLTVQSSLLWFGFTSLASYIWQRRMYPDVTIGSGMLLLIVIASVGWVTSGQYVVPEHSATSIYSSAWWLSSNVAAYAAFGLLAAAGSWMMASIYLGMLARRNRGTGYGLNPRKWDEYRLFPSFFVFIAYPLLTLSWVGQMLWSQQYLGDIAGVWSAHPRLWSVPLVWLLLTAHLFALRAPKPAGDSLQEQLDDEYTPVTSRTSKLPGFLLFLATVVGSVVFVGIHMFLTYIRSL